MSQTLFLKDNKPHVRLSQGEFEVTSECYTKGTSRDGESTWFNVSPTKDKTVGISEGETFEWPYGVEFVFQHRIGNGEWQSTNEYYFIHLASIPGSQRRKLARLLPEEKKEVESTEPQEKRMVCDRCNQPIKWKIKLTDEDGTVSAPSESQEEMWNEVKRMALDKKYSLQDIRDKFTITRKPE